METQYLQYFTSVAKHLNFNRAALECHVSQPALSAQIKKFEESLGCQLFFRSKRHVQLTPEGERILPKAKSILSEMHSVKELASQLKDPLSGTIRVGFSSCISFCHTFSSIRSVQKKYPRMKIHLEEDETSSLIEKLIGGKYDLILAQHSSKMDSPAFRYKTFDEVQLVHIITREPGCLKKAESQLIMVRGNCPLKQAATRAAEKSGYDMNTLFYANDIFVIKRMVDIGEGWSVIPESALTQHDRTLFKVTPIEDEKVSYAMAINHGPRSEIILDAFFDELQCRKIKRGASIVPAPKQKKIKKREKQELANNL